MTAHRIGVSTIAFPDPTTIDYDNKEFETLNSSVSFAYRIDGNIQTLSTKGVGRSDPYGILYVPDLSSDGCKSEEQKHVAANATRLANLPDDKDYALIAVAPWFSATCTLEYFAAARKEATKGILVYQPGRGNDHPPVLNDPSWALNDGGSWQSENTFPTYALSSMTGDIIMNQLSLYSGNLTSVPHGDELEYEPSDYIRLWATVATDQGAQLPSLWVFLVIVLAILIVAVCGTSVAMHFIQRRRRNSLQRRVLAGEVDLEALGVKRLNVSQQTLDKLPLYTYTANTAIDHEKTMPQTPLQPADPASSSVHAETENKTHPLVRHSSAPTAVGAPASSLSQPTCAICLDDFESNVTQVRELPCRHIFHPDCIDTFLLRNSSLCPLCKRSVLPPGACPVKITNVMVRRERHINRMRARGTTSPQPHTAPPGPVGSLGRRIGGAMAGRRIFSAPERMRSRPADIEMANNGTAPNVTSTTAITPPPTSEAPTSTAIPPTFECSPTHNRREWARQRALQMLGTRHAPASDVDEVDTRPRWRQTLNKVFPGFR